MSWLRRRMMANVGGIDPHAFAFSDVYIKGSSGSWAYICLNMAGNMLSPIIPISVGDTVTFSANSTNDDNGNLLLFGADYSYRSYYGLNTNPRTVTISDSNYSYCALWFKTDNLASSYVVNNTTGAEFRGNTISSSQILPFTEFRSRSPIASSIDWTNEQGDFIHWNGYIYTSFSYQNRTIYPYRMATTIGPNASQHVVNAFMSVIIPLERFVPDDNGYHIQFYGGGNTEAYLKLFDNAGLNVDYYSCKSSPRSIVLPLNTRYDSVQLCAPYNLYQQCFINDEIAGAAIWTPLNQ